MYLPEFTITNSILKNISNIEYARSIIENTRIMRNWGKQLEKDAQIRCVLNSLKIVDQNFSIETIKKFVDKLNNSPSKEASSIFSLIKKVNLNESYSESFEFEDIKSIGGAFRSRKNSLGTNPEEILAEMENMIDWFHSLEAKETHPIILSGILKAQIENVMPFENMNSIASNFLALIILKRSGYLFGNYICLEEYYTQNFLKYENSVKSVWENNGDLTVWLEFFTDGLARETSIIKEKIIILAKDTKIAKVSGRIHLTQRQEKIVEHLQDYGIMQNNEFSKMFPGISEDSILRDLKTLMDKKIIIKSGKTKSSRYELRD
ncbi:hypothetical protein A3H26_01740 [candidate division WWE3 bacterium RIFCSPLOWO2_12_FULL_36_10]|uniref:Fido domain-containing protein n=1 Tax=candidate division WWE3 bacterium RIFCSPLOWO2_12_FULL_36_10 TaxID=1802630 RepID=A0A1F4VHN1_UNCKA|nr:MAG: hypothetical protein A3H26_01740 [candidate division WWE3 bacterium RIFCSPLOWO2_12_FULL_36_10]